MQEKKRFSKWSNYKWSINGVKYTWDTFDTLPYDDKIYKIPIPTNEDENRSLMRFVKGQIQGYWANLDDGNCQKVVRISRTKKSEFLTDKQTLRKSDFDFISFLTDYETVGIQLE